MTRTAHTTATPDQVMPLILDFHEWELWSPWEGLDPQLNRRCTGPDSGVGAKYGWSGNATAGEGTMEITAATDTSADIALHFTKPFTADNRVRIAVPPSASGGSDLTWTMSGENTLPARFFFAVFRMEKTLAKQFDRGLAQLAAVVEGGTQR
ncbi:MULTISPECIES: SRPBCC family protein [Helcobacillus]|uniref:SRPBCC family protein n=1 Tax=Helcobacillus TaxID=1161125 RepID=UPI002552523F|nr:SRPBCC family protein [Helcobacillus massiliensis]MDK7741640.1 SRPBCC family protein [Helcobacillus massiliensis]